MDIIQPQTNSILGNSFSLPSWAVVGLLCLIAIYAWRKMYSNYAIRSRAMERFQFTHREVFPLLNKQETQEMYKVLDNTVLNAKMSMKHSEYVKLEKSLPKRINKEERRVCFNLVQ